MAETERPLWDWFASWGAEEISWDDVWPDTWPWGSSGSANEYGHRRELPSETAGGRIPGAAFDQNGEGPTWRTGPDGFKGLAGKGLDWSSSGDDHRSSRVPPPPAVDAEHGGRRADHPNQQTYTDKVVGTLADALEAVDTATHKVRSEVRNAKLRKKLGLPQDQYEVVRDKNGVRHVVKASGHVYNTLNDREASSFLERTKLTEGGLAALRQQLYYAGYYGDKVVNYGDDTGYTDDDVKAVRDFMEYANRSGGTVKELLPQLARQGRKLGGPLGTEVEFSDQPINQINEYIDANGLDVSNDWVRRQMRGIGAGRLTVADAIGELQKQVIAEYPAWEDQIKSGSTVKDLAAPYQKAIAKTLEVPLADVGVDDPLVKKGLQSVGDDGKPGIKPLWKFQMDLRKDPRWEKTNAAWDEVGGMAMEVMQMFGMQP